MLAENLLSTSGLWCLMQRFTRRTNPSKAVWMLISLIFLQVRCLRKIFCWRTLSDASCQDSRDKQTLPLPALRQGLCGRQFAAQTHAEPRVWGEWRTAIAYYLVRMFLETFFFKIHKLQFYSTGYSKSPYTVFIGRGTSNSTVYAVKKELHIGRENGRQ